MTKENGDKTYQHFHTAVMSVTEKLQQRHMQRQKTDTKYSLARKQHRADRAILYRMLISSRASISVSN